MANAVVAYDEHQPPKAQQFLDLVRYLMEIAEKGPDRARGPQT